MSKRPIEAENGTNGKMHPLEVATAEKSLPDRSGTTQTAKDASAPAVEIGIPPAAPVAATPRYEPYRIGHSGIIANPSAPDRGCDPFVVESPPASRPPGSFFVIRTAFYITVERVAEPIASARNRFANVEQSIRAAIQDTDEQGAWTTATADIDRMTATADRLRPQVQQAEDDRDTLLTADDDAEYAEHDARASGLRARLDRLDTELSRLKSTLRALHASLRMTASAIATRRIVAEMDAIKPRLDALCGMLSGTPLETAIDELIELDAFRAMLNQANVHGATATMIVAAITASHRADMDAIYFSPTVPIRPEFAPNGGAA